MSKRIDWRDMPALIREEKPKIARAAAKTLNAIAFDSLPEIVDSAKRNLDIKGNPRAALGMRVGARARANRLEANIVSKRGWLYYHLNSGKRRAEQGILWRGKRYLMWIIRDEFKTRRGRLRKNLLKKAFILDTESNVILVRRFHGQIQVLAVLSTDFNFNVEIFPEKDINRIIAQKGGRLFRLFLEKERARGR